MTAGSLLLPGLLAGTAVGILAADAGIAGGAGRLALVGLAAPAAAAALIRRRPRLAAIAAVTLGVALGAWRGEAASVPAGPGSVLAMIGEERRWISGITVEDPRPRGERQQVVLDRLRIGAGPDELAPVSGRLLAWLPRAVVVDAGDRLSFEGRVGEPRDFDGFAYRDYLARQGILATSSAFRAQVVAGSRGPVPDAMDALRGWLLHGLNAAVPEPEAALGAGILLGVRAGIAPEVSDAFATAGLTHVVAISGWNIAIVAALAAAVTRPLGRLPGGRWLAVGVAAASVGGYVLLTGASPSVVRAALMAGALVLARLGGSRAHAVAALMAAALVMLLAAPPVLWDVGFQLSALATAGLIWFAAPMERLLRRWPALVREPVALTLAAQLTTLPVILLNFERLSLVAPAANVLVIPLVPLVMLTCVLASLAGGLAEAGPVPPLASDALTWATGGAAWLYLRLMIMAGQVAAGVPMASLDVAAPAWMAAVWYPVLVIAHRRGGRADADADAAELPIPGAGRLARPMPLVAGTLAVLGTVTLASQPDGRLRLVMLDVGQGDALLVRAPTGATLLVDGGPDPDLAARRLGETLPFWQRTLDVMLLTHPHEDHVAGLVPALERYRVGIVMDPGRPYDNPTYPRFLALAAAEGPGVLRPARAGGRLSLGPATSLEILFPTDADAISPLPDGDINNASVVAVLDHGGFRALLTGDAEAPVERLLLARGALKPVDVLKVGHHGSDSSTGQALLDALRPRYALISAGAGNEYGHPHEVTLRSLAAIPGLAVLRTDRDGSVELVVDAGGIRVVRRGASDPGSIGPWPSPVSSARRSCWPTTRCRTGSSATLAGWHASPSRRRGCCATPACRWIRPWSRPRRSCMTSTSRRRAGRSTTASWPRRAWSSWAGRSWRSRSPPTRSPPCSTRSATRAVGPR
ncbi:MAG TPA: DNA internalization-related competence protein ComEC/Rec2 [Candidatus Limnocylindria bacterium]